MEILMKVMNEKMQLIFESSKSLSKEQCKYIVEISREKEKLAREKGGEFMQGAVPFWGGELARLVHAGTVGEQADKLAIQTAQAAWLFEHVYGGISESVFWQSNLIFTVMPDGAVIFTREPLTH